MIYVGAVLGGSECSDSPLLKHIEQLPDVTYGREGTVGSLDIVFHFPGSVYSPDFTGVRTGRFSRREAMLQIQVSVPREVMQDQASSHEFLSRNLRLALALGAERFKKAKIAYPHRAYVKRLELLGF